MNKMRFVLTTIIGGVIICVLLIMVIPMISIMPIQGRFIVPVDKRAGPTPAPRVSGTQVVIPTLTVPASSTESESGSQTLLLPAQLPSGIGSDSLSVLYEQVNPGVVSVQVYVEQRGLSGQGAGSGFILDEEGHILTNNHVVAQAQQVTVVFYNELEAKAEVVGTDANSDLAIIQVAQLPEDTHPLPLSDSDQVKVGEWVVAIGNPFGQQSSMSVGIISAVGRIIPTGVTPFVIPQAIQTDAAINPGNSGGPLLNLQGEVIGINAQIVTGGIQVNSGVGFAIPSNIVRRVATEEHSLAIQGDGFQEEMDSNLQPGEVGTLEVNLEPGTYEVYCSVGNHREEGMLLNLTVTEAETTEASEEAVTTEERTAAQTSEETVAEEEIATEPTEETITEEQPAAESAEETTAEEPAALPETAGVIVPWSQIGLIGVGALMLVGGLGLAFLRRKH